MSRYKVGLFILSVSITTLAANPHTPTQNASLSSEVNSALNTITPAPTSTVEAEWQAQLAPNKRRFYLTLYHPTYVLPYYDTTKPYQSVYVGNTPNGQRIMNAELKGQMSFIVPLVPHLFYQPNMMLAGAYTQLNYWQVYASSQYFRETNYEPEIFIEDHFHRNWILRTGLNHQSNGRGGDLERSWNRAMTSVQFAGEKWLVGVNLWSLIFQASSSDLHNRNIAHYLGKDSLLLARKVYQSTLALQLQNVENLPRRGSVMATFSLPITDHVMLYTQYFNGYGQSLIEYNHRTQGLGVGLALNDWI